MTNACIKAYNVGMSSVQYTIRSIPPQLDKKLRQQSEITGKSLNELSIESMMVGLGIAKDQKKFSDLDWFVGSLPKDNKFDDSLKWLDSLPKDL